MNFRPFLLMLLLLSLAALLQPAGAAWLDRDLIGEPAHLASDYSDTLLDLARRADVGYVEIRAANPGVDPWLPGNGTEVRLPTQHILPDAPRRGIVINLPELRLYFFPPQGPAQSFPIGIGREGWETPIGHSEIASKHPHPSWVPTASEHEENPDLPAVVPPGPDNPMGELALYLAWKGYAIHGTNRPYSIGRRDSHGCIRLYPEDIEALYAQVVPGTLVTVVNQLAKVGWASGRLYLEVHPSQADADAIEVSGAPSSLPSVDAAPLLIRAAGDYAELIDWDQVRRAEARRDGIPVPVTPPIFERQD